MLLLCNCPWHCSPHSLNCSPPSPACPLHLTVEATPRVVFHPFRNQRVGILCHKCAVWIHEQALDSDGAFVRHPGPPLLSPIDLAPNWIHFTINKKVFNSILIGRWLQNVSQTQSSHVTSDASCMPLVFIYLGFAHKGCNTTPPEHPWSGPN